MPSLSFFDAHLLADDAPLVDASTSETFPASGILYGASGPSTDPRWLPGRPLKQLLGPADQRYPQEARVIDLSFDDSNWNERLRLPAADWFPLCAAPRANGATPIIRLNAPNFASQAKGITKLARRFPATQFIVDPFVSCVEENWRAGVCLADVPNIWVTTLGLFGPHSKWKRGFNQEALYFVVGEIGAGKALFASGLKLSEWSTELPSPHDWLHHCTFLDDAQIALILRENAMLLFSPPTLKPEN